MQRLTVSVGRPGRMSGGRTSSAESTHTMVRLEHGVVRQRADASFSIIIPHTNATMYAFPLSSGLSRRCIKFEVKGCDVGVHHLGLVCGRRTLTTVLTIVATPTA